MMVILVLQGILFDDGGDNGNDGVNCEVVIKIVNDHDGNGDDDRFYGATRFIV